MVVATTLVTACPPSLFLETPLYSHYHLFLRSFLKILSPVAHASLFSSPCPARFPPEETSPSHEKFKRGGNLRDSLSFPPPPSSPSPRGIRGERRKADRKFRSLWIKVFSKLPSPPSSPPSSSIFLQVASEGASRKRERRNFGRCFLYLSWCWTYRGEGRRRRRQVFGNEILFQDCKINRERSPGLTLDWILTLWKCLIDIISRTNGEFTGGRRGGMLGWFTRDWRRRVLFPTPLEMLSGFNVWLSSNGWTKFVREW